MKLAITSLLVIGLIWGGATLRTGAAPIPVDIAKEACPNKIENYRNSVNWYRGPNRITVQAKTACGSKYGDEYELTDVTIEIRSGNQLITRAHSEDGAFWPGSHQMLIGKTDPPLNLEIARECVPSFDLMQIDLKTGEMRTPGMSAVLNSTDEVKCLLRRGHV